MQFASLISSLINIISLDVTSFNSAVTLKLKCGKVVCVEFFIFGNRSSVVYRATENLSHFLIDFEVFFNEFELNIFWKLLVLEITYRLDQFG